MKSPTEQGFADGYADSMANKYSPRCVRYALGSLDRWDWLDAYERGWDDAHEKLFAVCSSDRPSTPEARPRRNNARTYEHELK